MAGDMASLLGALQNLAGGGGGGGAASASALVGAPRAGSRPPLPLMGLGGAGWEASGSEQLAVAREQAPVLRLLGAFERQSYERQQAEVSRQLEATAISQVIGVLAQHSEMKLRERSAAAAQQLLAGAPEQDAGSGSEEGGDEEEEEGGAVKSHIPYELWIQLPPLAQQLIVQHGKAVRRQRYRQRKKQQARDQQRPAAAAAGAPPSPPEPVAAPGARPAPAVRAPQPQRAALPGALRGRSAVPEPTSAPGAGALAGGWPQRPQRPQQRPQRPQTPQDPHAPPRQPEPWRMTPQRRRAAAPAAALALTPHATRDRAAVRLRRLRSVMAHAVPRGIPEALPLRCSVAVVLLSATAAAVKLRKSVV